MTNEFTLKAAIKGLGTEFTPGDQPSEYAQVLTNRFINLDGDAEIRPGLTNTETPVSSCAAWTGKWVLVHEHRKRDGSTIDFATQIMNQNATGFQTSTDSNYYRIIKKDSGVGTWKPVEVLNSEPDSGGFYSLQLGFERDNKTAIMTDNDRPVAVQFSEYSIFVNDNMTPSYYDEKLDKLFPLNSLINAGVAATGTSAAGLTDSNVLNWANETLVASNDIIYNVTRNSWAIVTSVGSTKLEHTLITSAAGGATGLGMTDRNLNGSGVQAQGDRYEIWDMVENNFFPVNTNISEYDNVVVGATGTNVSAISVSSSLINSANTVLRAGDYVYNTTRNSLQRIASVSTRAANNGLALRMVTSAFSGEVSGQTTGDTFIFLKSAVPVASYAHVHYGRLYLVDAREKTRIFPSASDDFRDFTTFQSELNSTTIDYGTRQAKGEEILSLDTFQRYLIAAGRRNIYVSQGVDPIQDTSVATTDLQPVGLFTQGTITKRPFANIGSDMLYSARDGMRQFNITDVLAVQTANVSEVIKGELRQELEGNNLLEQDIQVIHYPRRNWVMYKIGDKIYNYNYTPSYLNGEFIAGGTWSKFTGIFAEADSYVLRENGDIALSYYDEGSERTYFYNFDKGAYNDGIRTFDSTVIEAYPTEYETMWVGPEEGRLIHNRGFRPFFSCDFDTTYRVNIYGDLARERIDDTITISAQGNSELIANWTVGVDGIGGGQRVNRDKYALRTYTDYFKVNIQTSGGGRDVISKMIFYGNSYNTR